MYSGRVLLKHAQALILNMEKKAHEVLRKMVIWEFRCRMEICLG